METIRVVVIVQMRYDTIRHDAMRCDAMLNAIYMSIQIRLLNRPSCDNSRATGAENEMSMAS